MNRRDSHITDRQDSTAAPRRRIENYVAGRGWFHRSFNDDRPLIVLTEANLRALRFGYAVVTSEAVIEVKHDA